MYNIDFIVEFEKKVISQCFRQIIVTGAKAQIIRWHSGINSLFCIMFIIHFNLKCMGKRHFLIKYLNVVGNFVF